MKKLDENFHLPVWKKVFLSGIFIAMVSFVMAVPRADTVDFSGSWLGKTNVPSLGPDEITLVLKSEKDSYTGSAVNDTLEIITPDTPIQNIEVEGSVISLQFPLIDGAVLSCSFTLEEDKLDGYWTHPSGSKGVFVLEKMQENAREKYADLVGDYKFVFEGEDVFIKIYIEDGVLCGMAEYSMGELKPVEGNGLKFKVVTPHGENWSFEFIKDDKGNIVECKLTDEDFPETRSITGVKVAK
jgi:hypothetical protein